MTTLSHGHHHISRGSVQPCILEASGATVYPLLPLPDHCRPAQPLPPLPDPCRPGPTLAATAQPLPPLPNHCRHCPTIAATARPLPPRPGPPRSPFEPLRPPPMFALR
eukprot:351389-Chlamydomonas_euryale.AAC.3